MRLARDHAAAHRDAYRPGGHRERMDHHRQAVHHRVPDRIVGGDVGQVARADPRLDRGARSEALDAIVVKAADAWRIVAGQARDADVADLAVAEAERRAAGTDQADDNPGAGGYI